MYIPYSSRDLLRLPKKHNVFMAGQSRSICPIGLSVSYKRLKLDKSQITILLTSQLSGSHGRMGCCFSRISIERRRNYPAQKRHLGGFYNTLRRSSICPWKWASAFHAGVNEALEMDRWYGCNLRDIGRNPNAKDHARL
jgi:hypothetical protein